MSLTNQHDTPKAQTQLALLKDAQRIVDVVNVMGKKVGKLAVYDPDKFVDLAELVASNKVSPGAFGETLLSIRITDSKGRARAVFREGRVKRGVLEWTKRGDLMQGWKRKDMAAFFDMSPTDKNLDAIIHAIRDVCKEHLHLAVGSDSGYLRVLTQKAISRKNDMRGQMMSGLAANGEYDNRVFRNQGLLPSGQTCVQLALYPADDDDRELS